MRCCHDLSREHTVQPLVSRAVAGTHQRADAHLHTPRAVKMRSGLSAKPKMWKSRSTGAVKGTWRLIGGTRMLVLTDICELATGADRVLARCSTFTHAPRGRLTKSCELFPSGEKQRTAGAVDCRQTNNI